MAIDERRTIAASAEGGEQGTSASDYLRAIRRRWWIPVLAGAIAMAAAVYLSAKSEKLYDSTATILFTNSEPIDTLLATSSRSLDPERDLNTGIALVKLDAVARQVKSDLHLGLPLSQLLSEVRAAPQGNSNVIEITARDASPERAAAIANGFAQRYVAFRRTSARAQYNEAAGLADAQLRALTPTERDSTVGKALKARLHELQVASALQTGSVQFVDDAKVPTSAATPRPAKNGIVGLILGLFFGCLIAVGLEFTDRRLKSEEDAEQLAGLPVLARVPRMRGGRGPSAGEGAEAYATAALGFRLREGVRLPETVLVTSAQPGEGKTTFALGVGRALASFGHRVILIEADLRGPSLARSLNLAPTPGVAAVLAGVRSLDDELVEVDVTPTVQPTNMHAQDGSLEVLVAGSAVPNPHLLLSSDRMHDLLVEARASADVVIIDAPAIGTVSDALTLTPALDTCIFVMRLNRTTADRARRALKALRDAGVDIAGVVITGTRPAAAYLSGRRRTSIRQRRGPVPDMALLMQADATGGQERAARNGSTGKDVFDEPRAPKP